MAYAVKYFFRWESVNGTTREIRVLKDGYSGSVIQRRLGRAPVLKKQHNGAVYGTSLEFYAECAVDGEFAEFYTSDPKAYRVDLYTGSTLLWQGYITPELYSEPDIAPPYDVQVIATDGIGELKLYDFTPQGLVTLRSMLTYLLGYTGLATDVYLISSIKPGGTGAAGSLLAKSINLDYMEGKTCYEVLTYILDTLHATITWWKGAWILARETNVKFSSGKVQCFNANGNSTTLPGSVVTLGKMYTNDAWPVGQLTSKIDPAKNSVRIQAPWHPVTALVNSDMTFDNGWTKAGGASYDTTNKGYHLPAASLEALPRIYQNLTLSALKNPMTLTGKFTGVSADLSLSTLFTAAVGYYVTYEVDETTYHLERSDEGLVWKEGAMPNILNYGNSIYTKLNTFDEDEVGAQEVSIEIPPFILDDMFPGGTLIVYVFGSCVRVYSTALDVVISKGYQDNLYLDNGARGEGDEVEIAIGRETRAISAYSAFLQGVLLDNGSLIYSFKDDYITANDLDFMSFIARDYARSYALPRLEQTGTVSLESAVTFPPLVLTKGAVDYWLEGYSWNMLDDELDISARSLPTATITVDSEVIGEVGSTTSSGASSSGGSGGGGGSIPITSYDEYFASLQSQIDAVSARNSFDELLASAISSDILTAQSIYGETLEVTDGATIGGLATIAGGVKLTTTKRIYFGDSYYIELDSNNQLHTNAPLYSDSWISAGGVGSGGGGGGGGTTVAWGTATSNYTPLTVGSDTRDLSLAGHTHATSDISDFDAAVQALIAGSDLATTVAGHTTSINTLNGYFTNGVLGVTHGGTGFSSYTAGDMLYASSVNTLAKLAGNSTATKKFLTMTSRTPSWGSIDANDLPDLYWANIRVSDTSNSNASPTLGVVSLKGLSFGKDVNGSRVPQSLITASTYVFDLRDDTDDYYDEPLLIFGNGVSFSSKTYGGLINEPYSKGFLINTSKLHLSDQLTFTTEQSDSGATLTKGLEYNTTYHAWHLHSNLIVDGFVSAGGVGSGGGGGGGTVSWGEATSNYTPLTIGNDTRNLSLDGHKHLAEDITDFTAAVQAIIGSTTTLDEYFAALQSQIDSVSARDAFDELSATVLNSDIITATDGYFGNISVDAWGTVGSSSVPVYFSAGVPTAVSASDMFPMPTSTAAANLTITVAGQTRTIGQLFATKAMQDSNGENIATNISNITDALATLQAQADALGSRSSFDELQATVLNADIVTATDIFGELTGNAASASKVNNALTISTTTVGATANTTYDGSAAKTIYSPTQMLNTTSTPTFAGLVDNGALTVKGSTTLGNNAQSDYLDVNAITTIAGKVTMQSTLNAIGYTAIGTIPSHTLLSNQLTVFGTSRFVGAIVLSNGADSVTLSISQDGDLEVDGDMYATGFISAGGVSSGGGSTSVRHGSDNPNTAAILPYYVGELYVCTGDDSAYIAISTNLYDWAKITN